MCFCPYLQVCRNCRASSVSRSLFWRVSTLASISLVVVHHVSNLKLAIVVGEKKMLTTVFNASAGWNRVMTPGYSSHIDTGLTLNFRHMYLILINRFITDMQSTGSTAIFLSDTFSIIKPRFNLRCQVIKEICKTC